MLHLIDKKRAECLHSALFEIILRLNYSSDSAAFLVDFFVVFFFFIFKIVKYTGIFLILYGDILMAYSSNRNKKVNTQYFQDLTESYKKSIQTKDTVDIVTFVEAKWGLNMELFPVQKFILKAFYGLELDDTVNSIVLPDEINSREIC